MAARFLRIAPYVLLSGSFLCLEAPRSTAAEFADALIAGIPHVRQKPDFCGEACAEMYLRKLHVPIDQNGVFDRSGLDPALGRGCYTRELARALRQIGFDVGPVWSSVPADEPAPRLAEEFAKLHADLEAGMPSIVCMHYDDRPQVSEHFRLVLGYESATDSVIYHEPAEAKGADRRMSRSRFLKLWPLKYDDDHWSLVRLRLKPGRIVQTAETRRRFADADYAQHVMALRLKRSAQEFSIVIEKPFVVIGDEPLETVKRRAGDTVRWAVERLKRDYFADDPSEILDIWLFQDSDSYERHTEALFGDKPTTPYGFFSHRHRALVMNIGTGGGTLVHEIVHPFIAANFPDCPSWFNEGLASLYEQSADRKGHIVGLTNWRLRGLQRAIRKGSVPSFETLCGTTSDQFYNRDRGTNYAQARYLCYYLQEHGLLTRYFHAFREHVARDPSGCETLKSIVGADDLKEFQKRWEAYVLDLTFDG